MDALLTRETLAGLVANDNLSGAVYGSGLEAENRLEGELGHGLPTFGGGFAGTTNLGFALSDGGAPEVRLGRRLIVAVPGNSGFEVNLDAVRCELANGNGSGAMPEHGVTLRAAAW